MGKQGKARKRRRVENDAFSAVKVLSVPVPESHSDDDGNCDDGDTILAEDLMCTTLTLQKLANSPQLLKEPACRPLRAALYSLRNPDAGTSLTALISGALRERAWTDALCHLAAMRIRAQVPKLGTLQRWIRDLDALEGNPLIFKVIDAIMRTVDPACIPAHDAYPDLHVQGSLRHHSPWICVPPFCDPVFERVKSGTLFDENEKRRLQSCFRIVQETLGPQRQPPNLHPAIVYLSAPDTIPLLATLPSPVEAHTLPPLPTVRFLTHILTRQECAGIIACAESVGMLPDQPSAGSATALTSVLAHNFYWLTDIPFIETLFSRVRDLLPPTVDGGQLRGLNRRFRVYRYVKKAVYRPHIDGAWPPSGVSADGSYVYDDSPPGARQSSRFTFLIYLNDEFANGETSFYTPAAREGVLDVRPVKPVAGCALVFPHADTVGSLVHEGSEVGGEGQAKYVIRTDVLYDVAGPGLK